MSQTIAYADLCDQITTALRGRLIHSGLCAPDQYQHEQLLYPTVEQGSGKTVLANTFGERFTPDARYQVQTGLRLVGITPDSAASERFGSYTEHVGHLKLSLLFAHLGGSLAIVGQVFAALESISCLTVGELRIDPVEVLSRDWLYIPEGTVNSLQGLYGAVSLTISGILLSTVR